MSTECAGCRILKFYMAKDAFTQSVLCVLSPRVFELDLKVSKFWKLEEKCNNTVYTREDDPNANQEKTGPTIDQVLPQLEEYGWLSEAEIYSKYR